MSVVTLKYNQVHGTFNRREIRMLAHALALPEERMDITLDKLGVGETITTKELLKLIERGEFVNDFNYMYNQQSGRYNSIVLSKGVQLIEAHLFSFDDLLKARLAFNIYEVHATENNKNKVELIAQTIRFCDYWISDLKLERCLNHYSISTSRILSLWEYFDILLICNRDKKTFEARSKKVIDISDPKTIDQQMMDDLNTKYLRDERNWFFQEKITKQKMVEDSVWPAKVAHQYQTSVATLRKAQLQRQLTASISSLKQSRAGSACSTPSHLLSRLRQSHLSTASNRSTTPEVVRSSSCLTKASNRITTPSTEMRSSEVPDRLQQLRTQSALLEYKYAIYKEDYMTELFPDGYKKPVTVSKPIERLTQKTRSPMYWSRRATAT